MEFADVLYPTAYMYEGVANVRNTVTKPKPASVNVTFVLGALRSIRRRNVPKRMTYRRILVLIAKGTMKKGTCIILHTAQNVLSYNEKGKNRKLN